MWQPPKPFPVSDNGHGQQNANPLQQPPSFLASSAGSNRQSINQASPFTYAGASGRGSTQEQRTNDQFVMNSPGGPGQYTAANMSHGYEGQGYSDQDPTMFTMTPSEMSGDSEYSDMHVPEEKVRDYAMFLGINPDTEPHLMHLAKEALWSCLPPEWQESEDEYGDLYYLNTLTDEMTYDNPIDLVYRAQVQQQREISIRRQSQPSRSVQVKRNSVGSISKGKHAPKKAGKKAKKNAKGLQKPPLTPLSEVTAVARKSITPMSPLGPIGAKPLAPIGATPLSPIGAAAAPLSVIGAPPLSPIQQSPPVSSPPTPSVPTNEPEEKDTPSTASTTHSHSNSSIREKDKGLENVQAASDVPEPVVKELLQTPKVDIDAETTEHQNGNQNNNTNTSTPDRISANLVEDSSHETEHPTNAPESVNMGNVSDNSNTADKSSPIPFNNLQTAAHTDPIVTPTNIGPVSKPLMEVTEDESETEPAKKTSTGFDSTQVKQFVKQFNDDLQKTVSDWDSKIETMKEAMEGNQASMQQNIQQETPQFPNLSYNRHDYVPRCFCVMPLP